MAISLDDIKKTKMVRSKQKDSPKKKSLRPWENFSTSPSSIPLKKAPSYDKAGFHAVKRAREIVEKNNLMIAEMRKRGHLPLNSSLKKESLSAKDTFNDYKSPVVRKKTERPYKIRNKQGFFGMIREIFNN